MIEFALILYYVTVALIIALPCIGAGIGQGLAGKAAIQALETQPQAQTDIQRGLIVGLALIETAAVFGVAAAIILVFSAPSATFYQSLAYLGIVFAIALPGIVIGYTVAQPAITALAAIARQPFFARNIINLMLITQSLGQTGIIFGFIIALFIRNQAIAVTSLSQAIQFLAAGIAIGLGSVGPAFGLGHFAKTACASAGINRNAYNRIVSFTFISEAIIETPIIFALVVALLLVQTPSSPAASLLTITSMLAAAFCIGIGTLAPGISSGRTAAAACKQLAYVPEHYSTLSRMSMIAQGLIDTTAIYALLISFLLLFFRT